MEINKDEYEDRDKYHEHVRRERCLIARDAGRIADQACRKDIGVLLWLYMISCMAPPLSRALKQNSTGYGNADLAKESHCIWISR